MKRARIIKRTMPNGRVVYVIQQRHSLFRWWWVDAWFNSLGEMCDDQYVSLKMAQENLCWFDGTKIKEEVVG